MGDAQLFFLIAMEPGHLRWKPRWRYGTITGAESGLYRVALDQCDSRTLSELGAGLDIRGAEEINAPSGYECAFGFTVGDDVLIEYPGHDKDAPVVRGYRRFPKRCVQGGWGQL